MNLSNDVKIEIRKDFQIYIAEVAELPGCTASGSTELEAIENIQPIIEEWLLNARERYQQSLN